MNATTTLTPTTTARPAAEPDTAGTPDRKIFFGTAAVLLAVTAVGLALGLGGGLGDAPTTSAVVPSTGTASHMTPDHILQPR